MTRVWSLDPLPSYDTNDDADCCNKHDGTSNPARHVNNLVVGFLTVYNI